MNPSRILIVEDEALVAKNIADTLTGLGYSVAGAVTTGEEAVRTAGECLPDLVLMDIVLEGEMDGADAARDITARLRIPIVYVTAYTDRIASEKVLSTEPYGYVTKPFVVHELHGTIEAALSRHGTERRLRESEERYRALVENTAEGIVRFSRLNGVIGMNPAAERILGVDFETAFGRADFELFARWRHEDRRPVDPSSFPSAVTRTTGRILSGVIQRRTRSDGDDIWISLNSRPVSDSHRSPPHSVVISFADITALKRAETELRESRTCLETLNSISQEGLSGASSRELLDITLENLQKAVAPVGAAFCLLDGVGRLKAAFVGQANGSRSSGGVQADFSLAPQSKELLSGSEPFGWSDLVSADAPEAFAAPFLAAGVRALLICPVRCKDVSAALALYSSEPRTWTDRERGTLRDVSDCFAIALHRAVLDERRTAAGQALGRAYGELERRFNENTSELWRACEELFKEVEERKSLLETIRSGEKQCRVVVETVPHGIAEVDLRGTITYANKALHSMLGVEDDGLIGKPVWHRVVPEEGRPHPEKTLAELVRERPKPTPFFYKNVRSDGAIVDVQLDWDYLWDDREEVRGFVTVVTDITDRLRAEEEIRRTKGDLERQVEERTAILSRAASLLGREIAEHREARRALREAHERLSLHADNSPIACIEWDSELKVTRWSKAAERIFGWSESEMLGRRWDDAPFSYGEYMDAVQIEGAGKADGSADLARATNRNTTKDGRVIHCEWHVSVVRDESGAVSSALAFVNDITAYIHAETELRDRDRLLLSIWRAAPMGISLAKDRVFRWTNDTWCRMFGYPVDGAHIGQRTAICYASEEEFERVGEILDQGLETETVVHTEAQFKRRDGSTFPGEIWVTPLDPTDSSAGLIAAFIDIADRKEAENGLRQALNEKSVLLKEIHHRVKNNLQVISSLLQIQASYLQDRSSRIALEETGARIRSMALLHERLYQSEDMGGVDVSEYIGGLTDFLTSFYANSVGNVRTVTDLEDVSFGINTAIPLGFIVTELYSNCLKHAFPGGRSGVIEISLKHAEDEGTFRLTVKDNGVGLPDTIDERNPQSLGLDLVDTFTRQLRGSFTADRSSGTEFCVVFREASKKKPTKSSDD